MLRPNPDPPAELVPTAPAPAPHVTALKEAVGAGKERRRRKSGAAEADWTLAPEVVWRPAPSRWAGLGRGYMRSGRGYGHGGRGHARR